VLESTAPTGMPRPSRPAWRRKCDNIQARPVSPEDLTCFKCYWTGAFDPNAAYHAWVNSTAKPFFFVAGTALALCFEPAVDRVAESRPLPPAAPLRDGVSRARLQRRRDKSTWNRFIKSLSPDTRLKADLMPPDALSPENWAERSAPGKTKVVTSSKRRLKQLFDPTTSASIFSAYVERGEPCATRRAGLAEYLGTRVTNNTQRRVPRALSLSRRACML